MGKTTIVDPIDSVGDIFNKSLNDEEASDMIKELTDKEIRDAMFDINDLKLLGQMGILLVSSRKHGLLLVRMFSLLLKSSLCLANCLKRSILLSLL